MRYIDADAFLERMKKTARYFDVKFDIEQEPTADVVPKSEVFLASSDATKKLLELHGYAVTHDEDIKREVAREIFEEIEKTVFADMDFFKELKKKYTEEK